MNTTTGPTTTKEFRGSVLDVVKELLAGGHDEAVIKVVADLVARNADLERLLANARSPKNASERISREQLDLFLTKLKETAGAAPHQLTKADETLDEIVDDDEGRPERPRPPKQPAVRRPPPPGLPRVENVINVPASERPCAVCGTERACIAHERTEVVDYTPAQVFVRVDVREIVACPKCDAEVARAPMGDKVTPGGAYGSGLVAKLVVDKYWSGMPLNRQNEELQRLGLSMPSSSMADQITWATDLLRPIWQALLRSVLGAVVMHVDGTGLPVRDADSPKGIVTGTLWGYVGDESAAVYLYTSTGKKVGQREGEIGPEQLLRKREGPVAADASNLFDASFKNPRLIEIGCNMHARRYFAKALDANDARAARPIAAFRALYDVEDAARGEPPERRLELRQARSKPIYEELVRWCEAYQLVEPPSSLLGRAIQYLINHRVALMRFLDDGRLPIDNGIVERLHRRPAVGRRNYLFAGSHAAGERAAIAYSVLATCYLVDVNPYEYLADVLPVLARGSFTRSELAQLAPAAWKARRAAR